MSRRWDWGPPPPAPSRPWGVAAGLVVGLAMVGLGHRSGFVVVGTASAIGAAHWLRPEATSRLFSRLSQTIGRVLGQVALTVVFGLVVVPLALLRRSDALSLRFPGDGSSFWRARAGRPDRRRWS